MSKAQICNWDWTPVHCSDLRYSSVRLWLVLSLNLCFLIDFLGGPTGNKTAEPRMWCGKIDICPVRAMVTLAASPVSERCLQSPFAPPNKRQLLQVHSPRSSARWAESWSTERTTGGEQWRGWWTDHFGKWFSAVFLTLMNHSYERNSCEQTIPFGGRISHTTHTHHKHTHSGLIPFHHLPLPLT